MQFVLVGKKPDRDPSLTGGEVGWFTYWIKLLADKYYANEVAVSIVKGRSKRQPISCLIMGLVPERSFIFLQSKES